MINRDNWKLTRRYLGYIDTTKQLDQATIAREKSALTHLLKWADSRSLFRADELEPIYPRYLAWAGLGQASVARACIVAKNFFTWLRMTDKRHTAKLTELFFQTLRPARGAIAINHDAYTLDEIRHMAFVHGDSLTLLRARAAVALLFVSGMRVGAFVTLPHDCLLLNQREVRQWPERGVETKGDKRATTYMLYLPDLLGVVMKWDDVIKASFPFPGALWYATLSTDGAQLTQLTPGQHRTNRLREEIKRLCELAGVRYRNPHQIRHGHAAYAMTLCRDVADYKAVSLNMMHADLAITDRVYSEMAGADIKRRIDGLGK
jgi:site-specific recombinase XerD